MSTSHREIVELMGRWNLRESNAAVAAQIDHRHYSRNIWLMLGCLDAPETMPAGSMVNGEGSYSSPSFVFRKFL